MHKLVAIGDSLSQGFMSGSISRTQDSFPAMVARAMGLRVPQDFRVPQFPKGGLPINIEAFLRKLRASVGVDVDTSEWVLELVPHLASFLDDVEDYWERGAGSRPVSYQGVYHNLSVWGFRVRDALEVSSNYCNQVIKEYEGWFEDDVFAYPAAPMYRTARRVLNPANLPARADWTQLDNLAHLQRDRGVENLILFLGPNDALGTVTELELRDMTSANVADNPESRRKWNLTHETVFRRDFETLASRLDAIVDANAKVFVGNVPRVTIPPVTQGLRDRRGDYYEYYGRFYGNNDNFNPFLHRHLTRKEAKFIDQRIDVFNSIIQEAVDDRPNWHLVNVTKALSDLAVKRKNMLDSPHKPLENYLKRNSVWKGNHPLLKLDPIPSSLRYESAPHGKRVRGGLFALDHVHPSTIGYGLIAELFLNAMRDAGVAGADPANLDWKDAMMKDSLLSQPPVLWNDVLATAARNPTLWDVVFRAVS